MSTYHSLPSGPARAHQNKDQVTYQGAGHYEGNGLVIKLLIEQLNITSMICISSIFTRVQCDPYITRVTFPIVPK
jgi:methenyltetrahydromethanopterin cyclohydrolase